MADILSALIWLASNITGIVQIISQVIKLFGGTAQLTAAYNGLRKGDASLLNHMHDVIAEHNAKN
jgi:hypothetical protein